MSRFTLHTGNAQPRPPRFGESFVRGIAGQLGRNREEDELARQEENEMARAGAVMTRGKRGWREKIGDWLGGDDDAGALRPTPDFNPNERTAMPMTATPPGTFGQARDGVAPEDPFDRAAREGRNPITNPSLRQTSANPNWQGDAGPHADTPYDARGNMATPRAPQQGTPPAAPGRDPFAKITQRGRGGREYTIDPRMQLDRDVERSRAMAAATEPYKGTRGMSRDDHLSLIEARGEQSQALAELKGEQSRKNIELAAALRSGNLTRANAIRQEIAQLNATARLLDVQSRNAATLAGARPPTDILSQRTPAGQEQTRQAITSQKAGRTLATKTAAAADSLRRGIGRPAVAAPTTAKPAAPAKTNRPTARERYNQLNKEGKKRDEIVRILRSEGYNAQ